MEGSSTDALATVDHEQPFAIDTPSFERLLRHLVDAGFDFVGFDEPGDGVVLQHDVELSLDRALTMARLETTLRIDGTYCVPLDAPVHDVSTVRFARTVQTLARLGHDVGLQFDPHGRWEERPSHATLEAAIDAERDVLERLLGDSVDVVSFRDPPEWIGDVELSGAINACRIPDDEDARPCFVDREWRTANPMRGVLPDRVRLLVHPGLWYPIERSEHDAVDHVRQDATRQVEAYFDAFDVE